MKSKITKFLIMAFIFVGCSSNNLSKKEVIHDSHTSEISLDWNATYKGILPCASCSGIETTITLYDDKTFKKKEIYLDTKGGTFVQKGKFTFTQDGNKIILKNKDGSKDMYIVGESRLIMLNKDGKKINSTLSKNYELEKVYN